MTGPCLSRISSRTKSYAGLQLVSYSDFSMRRLRISRPTRRIKRFGKHRCELSRRVTMLTLALISAGPVRGTCIWQVHVWILSCVRVQLTCLGGKMRICTTSCGTWFFVPSRSGPERKVQASSNSLILTWRGALLWGRRRTNGSWG